MWHKQPWKKRNDTKRYYEHTKHGRGIRMTTVSCNQLTQKLMVLRNNSFCV
jgi:hypothetical protein